MDKDPVQNESLYSERPGIDPKEDGSPFWIKFNKWIYIIGGWNGIVKSIAGIIVILIFLPITLLFGTKFYVNDKIVELNTSQGVFILIGTIVSVFVLAGVNLVIGIGYIMFGNAIGDKIRWARKAAMFISLFGALAFVFLLSAGLGLHSKLIAVFSMIGLALSIFNAWYFNRKKVKRLYGK